MPFFVRDMLRSILHIVIYFVASIYRSYIKSRVDARLINFFAPHLAPLSSCLRCSPPLPYQGKSAMKSIGNPKTVRRLHNDTSASDRLENLNTIIHSRGTVDRWGFYLVEALTST